MTMVSYPVWQTPSGNLGKIEALNFHTFSLSAIDPEGDPNGEDITYSHISGNLPPGMQVDTLGSLFGTPQESFIIDGVPGSVQQDLTTTFTIRATSITGGITDRNFSITITGNYAPQILTNNFEPLGNFLDGEEISIQLSALDLNDDNLKFTLASGELPLGVTLSESGLLSGFLLPNLSGNYGLITGWDKSRWDEAPWQFNVQSTSFSYSFTIQVTDGKTTVSRSYIINVYSHNDIRADSIDLTADTTLFTSDTTEDRTPILLTKQSDFESYANFISDNYFAFKFDGIDFDNVPVGYAIAGALGGNGWDDEGDGWDSEPFDQSTYSLPDGLSLDSETGWLTGYIPSISTVKESYTFAVYVYNLFDPTIQSPIRIFNLNILGDLDLQVDWITDSNLGYINAGSVSQLQVEAESPSGRRLYYSLEPGSKLPQGLTLQNDGIISGRCTFQTFSIDGSFNTKTTFDENNYDIGNLNAPTTFDSTYQITVNVSDYSSSIFGKKTFTIIVKNVTYSSYDDLYIACLPQIEKRELLNQILGNTDYFPQSDVYRPTDPWWGVKRDIKFLVGYGLTPDELSSYISAMQTRHYNKKFYFGDYRYATAKDANGNAIYDVIYVDLIEDTKTYKNVNGQVIRQIPSSSFKTVNQVTGYINDLDLMYNDVVAAIGTTNTNTLPRWQTSVQEDGKILGFQTAAVLAYIKPGLGPKVLYKLQQEVPQDIKLIPFVTDRYILDNALDTNFDLTTGKWVTKSYTTFDTGFKLSIPPVTSVDFAIDIPFDRVYKQSVTKINGYGGFDGSIGDYHNKLIIFAKQENYSSLTYGTITNNGWNKDNANVPGYAELMNNTSSVNQRGGIWQVTVQNSTLTLTFVREISINEVVSIRFGNRGGKNLQYSSENIGNDNQTVPKYEIANIETLELKSPTTFDNNATRFVNNTDQYTIPFTNDKYLKFPRTGVFS